MMEAVKYFAICFLLISSCEESEYLWQPCEIELDNYDTIPLYIDAMCSDGARDAAITAVDRLNEFARSNICEPLVDIVGTTTVDHATEALTGSVLACYYDEPDWYADSALHTATGSANDFDNIRIFMFKYTINSDWLQSLIMHELMHYVGIAGHTTNVEDIMQQSGDQKLNYTEGDRDHFCADGEYVCKN